MLNVDKKNKTGCEIVSVIIVNYRSWEKLADCLRSLQCVDRSNITLDIIVVDNCSNDGQFEAYSYAFPGVRFILNTGNYGYAHGCNTGAGAGRGEYLLFINPDTIVRPGSIELLITTIKDYPTNSILSVLQVAPKGRIERVERFFPRWISLTGIGKSLYRFINRRRLKREFSRERAVVFPDWVSGSVIFMRREAYLNLKGWDERYWMYSEDVDICKRAAKMGGKIVMLQQASFLHNHGGSSRINTGVSALTKSEVYISSHVYISIHKQGLSRTAMQVFLVLRALVKNIILALLSCLVFPSKRAKVQRLLLMNLCRYYANAFRVKSWISPRSICYREKKVRDS
ncbi:MAG: glycosyltransferase family 2 protein [Desulfatiglans sp.]|jgi:GT2 family glycosyltransferase|nr:glycosyltransferase family 2 protein [Desulfatiglans sp.]